MRRLLLTVSLVASLAFSGASTASAETVGDVHPDIAFALHAEPGGVVVDYYTAEWPALDMRLEVTARTSARSVGSCGTSAICAYSLGSQAGTKLSWTSCGSKSTAALATVGSIANARTSGTLRALVGGVAKASVGAGAYANVPVVDRALVSVVSC